MSLNYGGGSSFLNFDQRRPQNSFAGKTIAFCLPGLMYTGTFMTQFMRLLFDLQGMGVNFYISQKYSSMVNHARSDCLEADNYAGTMLTPFRGKVPYDYIMWIDSDMIFKTEDLMDLLAMDKDVAAGWYVQSPGNGLVPTNESTVVINSDKEELYEIYDLQGKLIYKDKITVPKTKVNVASMAKGIYIIKVGELSRKWVKNN